MKLGITVKELKEIKRLQKLAEKDNITGSIVGNALNGYNDYYIDELTEKEIAILKKAGFKVREEKDTYKDFEETGDSDVDGNKLFREVDKTDTIYVISW